MTELKLEESFGLNGEPFRKMIKLPAATPGYAINQKANLHTYPLKPDIIIIEITQLDENFLPISFSYGIKTDELKTAISLLEEGQGGK